MKKIHFDPGHGKKGNPGDPGAVNEKEGLIESDIVLDIAKRVHRYLDENYQGFVVQYTRTDDTFLSLSARSKKANDWGADVFVSFHINAAGGSGFESFIHPNASKGSVALQNMINQRAIPTAAKHGLGEHGIAYKKGNLAVLRLTHMPAVLTETCFLDNAKDIALLKNDDFLHDMAVSYAISIAEYLGLQKIEKAPNKASVAPDKGKVQMVKIIHKDKKDPLAVHNIASFSQKSVVGHVKEGEAFTIKRLIENKEGRFYELASGLYITASPKYVKVIYK